ncbi:UNVERIFIED_CONTAM: hypothetical protein HDU68_001505 [Siphonaria sp. JEL0065]|nr:hypothetical protein HDU68_001505 [Siphonaria sp. JEL0065]
MTSFATTLASTPSHVSQIHAIMVANQKTALDASVAAANGFLSIEFSLEYLTVMLKTTPPVIAISNSDGKEKVVGYALAVTKEVALSNEFLAEGIVYLESNGIYKGTQIKTLKYLVMGQICVADRFRGIGVVPVLYKTFAEEYRKRGYDVVCTEVARLNTRSFRAHQKAGWVVFGSMISAVGVTWDMILLDLR